MKSLGTLLVRHDWITKQQLGLAISKQREIGGRLGTCLLEMGAVEEDLLNRGLAEQQGVPVAAADVLREIPEKVTQLLPAPIAIRYRAVPFRAGHSEVDIAMQEVDNLWLQDELSFIIGRRLNAYIANEARIAEALSSYYGAPLSERFAKLLERLNREINDKGEATPHPQSRLIHSDTIPAIPSSKARPGVQAPSEEPKDHPFLKVVTGTPSVEERPTTIPLSSEELASLGVSGASERSTSSAGSGPMPYSRDRQLGRVESTSDVDLSRARGPQEVGAMLLAALTRQFTRVMLFKVTRQGVRGWLAEGPGLDRIRFEQFLVPFDQPSIFLNLREGGSFYLGRLPDMQPHRRLVECWSKELDDDCVVFPVRVRDRLVTLVYGDRGPIGLEDLDLNKIRQLTAAASTAFELCIMKQKNEKRRVSSR